MSLQAEVGRWHYRKLFLHRDAPTDAEAPASAPSTALDPDGMVRSLLAPLLAELASEGLHDRWFFLRYSPGGFHLRLRLRARSADTWDALGARLDGWLISAGYPGEVADYVPETAKHGGPEGMDLAERWFQGSSEVALGLVDTAPSLGRRTLVAAWSFHQLLKATGWNRATCGSFLEDYARWWRQHGHAGQAATDAAAAQVPDAVGVGDALAQALPAWLADSTPQAVQLTELLGESGTHWQSMVDRGTRELRGLQASGRLAVEEPLFLANMAHTHLNRLGLGPAAEAHLATVLAKVFDAPSPVPVAAASTLVTQCASQLRSGQAALLLLADPVTEDIDRLNRATQASGGLWLEPVTQVSPRKPFAWIAERLEALAVRDPELASAVRRWVEGNPDAFDPRSALPVDPLGVHFAAAELLERKASQGPLVLAGSMANLDADSCDILQVALRRCPKAPLAVVLSGAPTSGCWDEGLAAATQLAEARGERPVVPATLDARTLARGVEAFQRGAVKAGWRTLAPLLDVDSAALKQLPVASLDAAWAALARHGLYRGAEPLIDRACHELSQSTSEASRELAQRIRRVASRQGGDTGGSLSPEVVEASIDRAEDPAARAWCQLDAALARALAGDPRAQAQHLRAVLAGGATTLPQARAAAHVWLATHEFLAGDREAGLDHARRALELFDTFGEVRRGLSLRLRVGHLAALVGRREEAVRLFERCAREATWVGRFTLAAQARTAAVVQRVALGQLDVAAAWCEAAERAARGGAGNPHIAVLDRRAACELALGRGDVAVATQAVEALFGALRHLTTEEASVPTLHCHAVLLGARVLQLEGRHDAAERLFSQAEALVGATPPGDRESLEAALVEARRGRVSTQGTGAATG